MEAKAGQTGDETDLAKIAYIRQLPTVCQGQSKCMLTWFSGSYTWDRKPQPSTAALGARPVGENRLPGLRDLLTAFHRGLSPRGRTLSVTSYGDFDFAFPA